MKIRKFPRTPHLEGSNLQIGDDTAKTRFSDLSGDVIVTEKLDDANAAVSFDASGALRLQSRGHYLTGGGRERHFALFKTWANTHARVLHMALGHRFVMYGEWLFAKHTIFYDQLPHFFVEFDVLDRQTGVFLSEAARHSVLAGLPVMAAPVLHRGRLPSPADLVGPSHYKSGTWRDALAAAALQSGSRSDFVDAQTEDSDLAEGLYLKREAGDHVIDRYKFVRPAFKQAIDAADGHWHDRPILPNRLADGVDIFAPNLGTPGAYDAHVR
jgi:hypothetical protein